jgi:DNA replicative helicase MCM subunit Mcm2 (Cdc46/Mcm family)
LRHYNKETGEGINLRGDINVLVVGRGLHSSTFGST